jgi:hypothetical protein
MKQPMKGKTPPKGAQGPKMAPPFAAKKKAGGKSSAMKRFAAGKMEC